MTLMPALVGGGEERVEVRARAVVALDGLVVGHVVAVVARRLGDRHQPQPVDAEVVGRGRVAVVEVVELRRQPGEVADPVAVAVREAAGRRPRTRSRSFQSVRHAGSRPGCRRRRRGRVAPTAGVGG